VFAPIHLPPLNPHCRVFHRPMLYDSSYTMFPEVETWLKDHVTGNDEWRRGYFVCEDLASMMVSFVHKHEAMLFKMVWS
jgi:hypothetical protein